METGSGARARWLRLHWCRILSNSHRRFACCAAVAQVQRKWLYLAPIFARGALPSQQARFRSIDEDFRRIMGNIEVRGFCVRHPCAMCP